MNNDDMRSMAVFAWCVVGVGLLIVAGLMFQKAALQLSVKGTLAGTWIQLVGIWCFYRAGYRANE